MLADGSEVSAWSFVTASPFISIALNPANQFASVVAALGIMSATKDAAKANIAYAAVRQSTRKGNETHSARD